MDTSKTETAKPAPDMTAKQAEAAHPSAIWSVPTGVVSGESPTLVASGPRHELKATYMQLVGKNPRPATVGYALIDAGASPPFFAANTFAV